MGDDELDRAAILARRQRFIALALSGLAACGDDSGNSSSPMPCLDVAAPTEGDASASIGGPTESDATASMSGPGDDTTTGDTVDASTSSTSDTGGADSSSTTDASSSGGEGTETGTDVDGTTGMPQPCLGARP